jgi:hypothetical protein
MFWSRSDRTGVDAIRQIGGERGDVLSVAPGVRRAEERAGEARLKELELENSRLRKAVSDLTLDKLILQEAARETSSPARRRACIKQV